MPYPLAIFVPVFGVRSETFIHRHVHDLLPAQTVTLTEKISRDAESVDVKAGPTLVAGNLRSILRRMKLPIDRISRKAAAQFVKQHGVQVFMGEYLDHSLQWLPFAQDVGVRFFAHAHGYDVSRCLREPRWVDAYRRYNESHGVIVMSEASRARLTSIGIDGSKIHKIPYGVDVLSEPMVRERRGPVRCVAVGRMVAKKAPLLTLEAFRRASAECPHLRLDYVGAGELLPDAQEFVRSHGLQSVVTLHGGKPRFFVQELMREGDIFLQHSITDPDTGDEEGLPVAILEAMANGLPVISTIHAGIPEAVRVGVTGYLVKEGDVQTMGSRLLELALNNDLRCRMGLSGWERASAEFTWKREQRDLLRTLGLQS